MLLWTSQRAEGFALRLGGSSLVDVNAEGKIRQLVGHAAVGCLLGGGGLAGGGESFCWVQGKGGEKFVGLGGHGVVGSWLGGGGRGGGGVGCVWAQVPG